MRFALAVLFLFSTLQTALTAAVPFLCTADQTLIKESSSRKPIFHSVAGDTVENSYIVKVRDDILKKDVTRWLGDHLDRDSKIQHDYDPEFFNAFAGIFTKPVLNLLRDREDIEYIRADAVAELASIKTKVAPTTQYTAPWGLARIANSGPVHPPYYFQYNTPAGAGVDIYVVDTGIFTDHADFGGRASWGWTAPGLIKADVNGHGTHCAAIAGGTTYGVAKNSNLIAVKAVDDDGNGKVSDIIAAIQFVCDQARSSLRSSVISMNLRVRPGDIALDSAVQSAINEGVHMVVAAGNDNTEASTVSPARVSDAIAVSAMDIEDVVMPGANFGIAVDMYAPGVNVLSAWIGHPWASALQSGTSTAAPYVAGIAAYNLGVKGKMSAEDLRILLHEKREKTVGGHLAARI